MAQPADVRLVTEAKLTQALADNTSGGFYLDKDGQRVEYVYVVSDTDPGQSKVIDGKTYEVWWVQTAPPDPSQWVPKPVTASIESRSYTVPVDAGATYTVDGVSKPAGTYALGTTAAKSLPWAAVAKSGYSFKAGATTSGTFSFPAKVYASGDVLMSDSFNRADGPLVGSTSDSFEGGEPHVWVNDLGSGGIVGNAIKPAETFFRPRVRDWASAPQEHLRLEWVYGTVGSMGDRGGFEVETDAGFKVSIQKGVVYATLPPAMGGGNKWYTSSIPTPKSGERLAVYTSSTPEGWRKWTMENLTTGAKGESTIAPAAGNQTGGAYDDTGAKFVRLNWSGRGDEGSVITTLDSVTVKQP